MGVTLVAASATLTPNRISSIFALVSGLAGIILSYIYLRSPVWRLAVDIQDDDLVVWNGPNERLRLPWAKVKRVVVDPDRELCFVDGGTPETSLLVPGPAAPASYVIAKREELIEEILNHVDSDLICDSSTLDADDAPNLGAEGSVSNDPCITDPKD